MIHSRSDMLRKCLAEGLGTFAMVFAGTGAIVVNDVAHGAVTHVGIALTFGLVVMAMIVGVGDVSGAHLNPAVTAGFWFARRFPARLIVPYMISQLAGALLASLTLRFLFADHPTLGATLPAGAPEQSFVLEVILAAILMLVILAVATGPKEKGLLAGTAIGGVIAFEAMFAGPICGASMNPVRSFAPAIVSTRTGSLWIYLTAPFLGVGLAVIFHRLMHPANNE